MQKEVSQHIRQVLHLVINSYNENNLLKCILILRGSKISEVKVSCSRYRFRTSRDILGYFRIDQRRDNITNAIRHVLSL